MKEVSDMYVVLRFDNIDMLVSEVNRYLASGFHLVGGVSTDKMNHFLQAMCLPYISKKTKG